MIVAEARTGRSADGGTSRPFGTSLMHAARSHWDSSLPALSQCMSREDPLAPLEVYMAEEEEKKATRQAKIRLTLGWFMTILMLGWVSKYAYGFV
tara:strand:- start:7 stop:291 length:285 start_codon:yes stop_codon:yes gene_type:complete